MKMGPKEQGTMHSLINWLWKIKSCVFHAPLFMIQVMYLKEKSMLDLPFVREMSSFYKPEKDLDSDFINI